MDYILSIINEFSDDPNAVRFAFSAIIAIAVVLFGLGAVFIFTTVFGRERARVQDEVESGKGTPEGSGTAWLATILAPVARIATPGKKAEFNKIQAKMSYAGFRSPNAVGIFYSIKLIAMIGLPAVVFAGASYIPGITQMEVILAAWIGACLGFLVPNKYLTRKVAARQKRLRNGFPDALDLLVVCSEAGLGLGPAIQRVADELVVSHPELADELNMVGAEMRVGVERSESLHNLVTRNGLEDFRGFVATISQAMRFGSSISDTLRIYADEFRDKRMQRAEEIAEMLPLKMIFPLAMCLLPAFMIVALAPSAIRVLNALGR